MSGSINRATVLGHLGADPEVRSTRSGARVVTLSIATSEQWKDKASGEKRERTEWHRIVIFNEAMGEVAEKYLRKGSKALIEGQLQTRKWQDQSGADRYSTEIVLHGFDAKLVLLDRRGDPGRHDYSGHERAGFGSPAASGGGAPAADLDDDVPF